MSRNLLALLTLGSLMGCAEQPAATVRIETPRDGAVVNADSVQAVLAASGIEIVPADGEPTPGRAHHHIFVDRELTPAGQPIPAGEEGVVHLGTGDSVYTLPNLTPGRHRLIAVLALGSHVPVDPWAVDTVYFTVEEGPE
jgi:Domain of unknown function (DUF4399)